VKSTVFSMLEELIPGDGMIRHVSAGWRLTPITPLDILSGLSVTVQCDVLVTGVDTSKSVLLLENIPVYYGIVLARTTSVSVGLFIDCSDLEGCVSFNVRSVLSVVVLDPTVLLRIEELISLVQVAEILDGFVASSVAGL
jgi:hypothetical protein